MITNSWQTDRQTPTERPLFPGQPSYQHQKC